MAGNPAELKQWIKCIAALEFDDLVSEISEKLGENVSEETNRMLFKLVLHLSHAAYQCDRKKTYLGFSMWQLCNFLCSNMSTIPDYKRFFPSVFHITKCLMEMKLYDEAAEIFKFVTPGDLWKDESREHEEMYLKASNQWKAIVCNDLLRNSDLTSQIETEILKRVIPCELDTAKLASRDSAKSILDRIVLYSKHIREISKRSAKSSSAPVDFKKFFLEYISKNLEISLNEKNENEIFESICVFVAEMIGRVTEKDIRAIGQESHLYFAPFQSCLRGNKMCRNCFQLYENICKTFLRPIEDFTSETVREIEKCKDDLEKIIVRGGYGECVKSVLYAAYSLFLPLLGYWEGIAKSKHEFFTSSDLLAATLKFFSDCSSALEKFKPSGCRCATGSCDAKYDDCRAVSLRLKSLSVAAQVMSEKVTEELSNVVVQVATLSAPVIGAMKKNRCARWSELWGTCGAYLYNTGVYCEKNHYEQSVKLHTLCLNNLIALEGLRPKKPIVNLNDPLSGALHRLTCVHFNHGDYHKAAIFCSLNGLLSHSKPDSKAYRYWANIKRNAPELQDTTMLRFLRVNAEAISRIVKIKSSDYNEVEVCLREIKGLEECRVNLSSGIIAALDKMERLNASPARYAQGVQSLGYHLLNFKHEQTIAKYLKKAMSCFEGENNRSPQFRWSYGDLQFYKFVEQLAETSRKTTSEMKSAESTPLIDETASTTTSPDVVPTYSTITLTVTIELEAMLKLAVQRWEEAFAFGFEGNLKDWPTSSELRTVTIAGEYARLYEFEALEARVWKLAFKLAQKLHDNETIVYVASRCLAGLQIDDRWINKANESVRHLAESNDKEINETIASYKLRLANYYFTKNEPFEGVKCFREVADRLGPNFLADIPNYLLRNEITMNHLWNEKEYEDHQLAYHGFIVEIFYGLLTLDANAELLFYGKKKNQLYQYDILLEITNNFAVRVMSLLSFQEISSHLHSRLKCAQTLGAALRVAECLKSLCHISLARAQIDDCEVKLQGLEQILELFAKRALSPGRRDKSATLAVSPTRSPKNRPTPDITQSDASPVLLKKSFTAPDFMLHGDMCQCFKCTNTQYQFLAFAATHIRAQLYTLQRNSEQAGQHFAAGLKMWKRIITKNLSANHNATKKIIKLQRQQIKLEHVMFLLNYSRFLKFFAPAKKPDATEISHEALNWCEIYQLKNHPIYLSVTEFIFECRFEKVFTKAMYAKFTVPAIDEMDLSCYFDESKKKMTACSTPARDVAAQDLKNIRRKKTPPFLKLNKVPIDLTEDDEVEKAEPPISTSPTSSIKRARRKISERDYSELAVPISTEIKSATVESRVTTQPKMEKTAGKTRKSKAEQSDGDQSVVVAIASISLDSVGEDKFFDGSQNSEPLDQLADMIQELKVEPRTAQSSRKTRNRKKSAEETASDSSLQSIDKITETFDDLALSKDGKSSLDPPRRGSSKSRKSARNLDSARSKTSSLLALPKDENAATISTDSESDTGSGIRRTSARLRRKNDDSSAPKSSGGSKSSNKPTRRVSGSDDDDDDDVGDEVVINTRTRKRGASSSSSSAAERPAMQEKQLPKSTRTRVKAELPKKTEK